MLTFIDLFAGIGGFRSGLERCGMKCVGYVEKDKFARKSYEAIYDTTGEWTAHDIQTVKGEDIPSADVWTFGFPCQDISNAGRKRGLKKGTRSGLFYEVMRLLDETNKSPKWIIIENVKGLLSTGGGQGFLEVCSQMDERGYDLQWRVFNSKNYGVPQSRERVYVVGHLRDGCRREILFDPGTNGAIISQIGNIVTTGQFKNPQRGRVYDPTNGVAPTIATRTGGGLEPKILTSTPIKFCDLTIGAARITDSARTIIARYTAGIGNLPAVNSGVLCIRNGTKTGYLEGTEGDGVNISYPNSTLTRGRVQPKSTPTITCTGSVGVIVKDDKSEQNMWIRKLTPRECWRLQGFTDEQFDKAKAVNSDTQLYKQAGNAVTVNVVEVVGRAILESEANDKRRREGL